MMETKDRIFRIQGGGIKEKVNWWQKEGRKRHQRLPAVKYSLRSLTILDFLDPHLESYF
jgi:hypothetical protein